ncbi:MAG: DUF2141 domain-containing protein [Sphingobium sp.]
MNPPHTQPPSASTGEVDVTVEGLRSTRGMLRLCLTRDPHYFPKCEKDPAARRGSISASSDAPFRFEGLEAGNYALLVLHDENGNARIDTMLGIPKEGVGFSRNPKLFMGPPPFDKVQFGVSDQPVKQIVQLRYFL